MPKLTVAIALSGGVDSSVAAALLKKQGYRVIGLYMHLWHGPSRCCSIEAQHDARRVAQFLNIPFYVLNFTAPFKNKVVRPFLSQMQSGLTPNPCIQCNKYLKFDELLSKAKSLGADKLATGHYIQLKQQKLFKGRDKLKDQSYFLYNLTPQQLKSLLFPLGNYTKPQVKAWAKKFKLPLPEKPESQDICFIPPKQNTEFLKQNLKLKSGKVIDLNSGKIIGRHQGLALYTIGQHAPIGGLGPWFVKAKDQKSNVIFVTNQSKQLLTDNFKIRTVNWINGQKPAFPLKCKVQTRYHAAEISCIVGQHKVVLTKPARAITPGQSAVFYQGKQLIGGGIIC